MKKLVMCFDRARRHPEAGTATNAHRLFHLLDDHDGQITWYHPGVSMASRWHKLRWREAAAVDARAAIAEAYQFLVTRWQPGDRIYMFGVGRGGYCAQTLTRLLATVGVLPDMQDAMAAYTTPGAQPTQQDWQRARHVAAELAKQRQIPVPIWFLGLWDSLRIPGFTHGSAPAPMHNVELGRHAVAIDGRYGERLVSSASEHIEEVWFRGTHRDVVGGHRACRPLAEITFDWMLDGAVRAGLAVPASRRQAVVPDPADALTETTRTISPRRVPEHAAVHSSVELYLRQHSQYWQRLPVDINWSDLTWAERSERLNQAQKARAAVKLSGLLPAAS